MSFKKTLIGYNLIVQEYKRKLQTLTEEKKIRIIISLLSERIQIKFY